MYLILIGIGLVFLVLFSIVMVKIKEKIISYLEIKFQETQNNFSIQNEKMNKLETSIQGYEENIIEKILNISERLNETNQVLLTMVTKNEIKKEFDLINSNVEAINKEIETGKNELIESNSKLNKEVLETLKSLNSDIKKNFLSEVDTIKELIRENESEIKDTISSHMEFQKLIHKDITEIYKNIENTEIAFDDKIKNLEFKVDKSQHMLSNVQETNKEYQENIEKTINNFEKLEEESLNTLKTITLEHKKSKVEINESFLRLFEDLDNNRNKVDDISKGLVLVQNIVEDITKKEDNFIDELPSELVLTDNEGFDVEPLKFTKLNYNSDSSSKEYSALKSLLLNEGAKTGVLMSTINSMKGLYSTIADPSTLMKLSSGGFGSAVMDGSKIAGQVGFTPVNTIQAFSPMIIMQILGAIVGQYYMQGITKQLNIINEKLDKLLHLHHNEKFSELQSSYEILSEISKKSYLAIEDIQDIRNIHRNSKKIYKEYTNLIAQAKVENLNNEKKLTKEKIKAINDNYINSDIENNSVIAIFAGRVIYISKLLEAKANMRMAKEDKHRIFKFKECLDEILNTKDEFSLSYKKITDVLEKYIETAREAINSSWINEGLARDTYNKLLDKNIGFKNEFDNMEQEIITTTSKIKEKFEKPVTTYLIVDENNKTIPIVINEE